MVINVRALLAENQVLPGPSPPAGQRMLEILLNPDSDEDGLATTSAMMRGRGTREEENGNAPVEKGTLGLLVPLRPMELVL